MRARTPAVCNAGEDARGLQMRARTPAVCNAGETPAVCNLEMKPDESRKY
jgi:hypothetical protein